MQQQIFIKKYLSTLYSKYIRHIFIDCIPLNLYDKCRPFYDNFKELCHCKGDRDVSSTFCLAGVTSVQVIRYGLSKGLQHVSYQMIWDCCPNNAQTNIMWAWYIDSNAALHKLPCKMFFISVNTPMNIFIFIAIYATADLVPQIYFMEITRMWRSNNSPILSLTHKRNPEKQLNIYVSL